MRLGLRTRDRLVPLGLAAGCYLLALLQRPGLATSDTKIDLHVDPSGFLGDVASVWSPTGSLGHIQGGQYGGYLWPMGPFFALLHGIGISPWVAQRLWLGTLLALAAWGVVRLMDALLERPRGAAHVVAAVLFAINPYVVVFTSRTTITLLGYALLPWLLLVAHRGLRDPRRWWWAAAFALLVTSSGGGVNAAVTGWLLVGPLLLVLYEPLVCGVPWKAVRAFVWRAAVAGVAASIWWLAPVLVQASYGIDFLKFTEQVGSIWNTTSLPESLRLMGYWPSYLGVGYTAALKPYFGDSGTLLFNPAVLITSLLVPALALAGFLWTRRWRYGPFFLLLGIAGLLIMSSGFPDGTPLRKAATFTYNHVQAVQFLRTTYKAGPLLALALGCLGGAAFAELWRRLSARTAARAGAVAVGAALIVLASLPLFEGRAVELTWKRIPAAWKDVGRDLDRGLPRGSRAVVLPGAPFAFYRWGGTVDPILPALTNRPVAIRNVPPYDDLHAVDMLWTTDNLVHQERLLPGELPPLLDLLGARSVVVGSDDDVNRSGGMPPAEAARELRGQPGFAQPARSYGPFSTFAAPTDTLDPPLRLPEVRRYDVPVSRGLVRIEPAGAATVVDGAASGVADAAAVGGLPRSAPLFYAGDLDAGAIRRAALAGGSVVITDSNRRRAFVPSRPRQSYGWTLPASVQLSADASSLDPFGAGSAAQTVASYSGGITSLRAPYSPQIAQFPEHRPFAAFDGDLRTTWIADAELDESRQYVEATLSAPRDIPFVDVLPDSSNPLVVVTHIAVNGHDFAVHGGWNRLRVGLHAARTLRLAITGHHTLGAQAGSVGGIREVRVPGLHPHEDLRPPVLAERALAGADLSRTPLAYVFERTTADDPLRRGPVPPAARLTGNRAEDEAALVQTAQDAEPGLDRVFSPPVARRWRAYAWATVSPDTADPVVDRLAGGVSGGAVLTGSGRFEGRPAWRASSAFDGRRASAWVAPWNGRAWIAWRTPRPRVVRRLVLVRSALPARFPSSVRLSFGGGRTPPLRVGADGSVVLPRPVRARAFRLDVLAAGGSPRPAVALSEVAGAGVPRVRVPRSGAVRGRCGDLSGVAAGGRLTLRPSGTVAALDAGSPLRASACGSLALPAGRVVLHVASGVFRPLVLGLTSPAPSPIVRAARLPGRVTDPGRMGRGTYKGVRVQVSAPSWLVLGESYSRGWRAECNGRSLGEPSVIDGFANGWHVSPGCTRVSLSFAPQKAVWWGYAIGALGCLVLLLLMVVRRPRRVDAAEPRDGIEPDDRPWRLPAREALLVGVAAAVVFGFVFALRAGVVIGPVTALVLWRGMSARTMILIAGALLAVVVPLIYVIFPATDRGGYDPAYPVERLGAHWVTVGAVVLLIFALARTLRVGRVTRRAPGAAGGRARQGRSSSRYW